MRIKVFAFVMSLTFAMLACSLGSIGGNETISPEQLQAALDELPTGDAARGEESFRVQPCKTCHVDLAIGPVFPGNPPLATVVETRKSDYSAELYLYESIVAPNTYVVPGFKKDIMPAEYNQTLTEQELADLIAYLMNMK